MRFDLNGGQRRKKWEGEKERGLAAFYIGCGDGKRYEAERMDKKKEGKDRSLIWC